ncbi:autoinducer 2 ABC transporter substrate-binding protein [Gracilibacillus salinarum]|uniref:Autoinducer 2 ABC transporter substrate-binding protein n=1 Tax=Gracilibacillus salinarum TaxID=2932255 RepID=A0ABY4GRK5_9BACI|nr:autoinducer 2 ABC transporter substrate-binding protein [Gracilibacillus salinarum]UOQ86995.1 autoinducer 2 ABC transporter substrate-binding protein [Gracilibacillus salinarum]
MKKLVTCLTLLFVLVLAACGSNDEAQGSAEGEMEVNEEMNSFFINPKSIGPAYFTAAEQGAEQAAEDLGVQVIFNAPTETSSSDQINMIQDMMVREVDGIGISPNDGEAVVPVISDAIEQDIPVVTWDSDAPNSERAFYVTPSTDSDLGEAFAEEIAQQMEGEGQVAFMVAGLGSTNQIDRVDAAEAYLEENYPEIEIVTVVASDDDQQKSYDNAQNLLNTYPDLAGIVGFAGGEPPAAAQAVTQAIESGRMEAGDIAITGFAVPSLVKGYIEDGIIEKIITWDPAVLGYTSVYVLNEMANGNSIPEGELTIENIGSVYVEGQNIFSGTIDLTIDNVNDFDF